MEAKARNWIEIPADARFLGGAEATLKCMTELQDLINKAD
jgi:hypothetical protein